MEKENQGILEMIPPLRGGDFQGIAGLSSDDSLLVGVSTARERSLKKAPALSNIGSMSPARLSLSTVASPHCRLLFHLAGRILAEKQRRLSGQPRTKRLSSRTGGLEVKLLFSTSGQGRNIFLDIPLYRTGDYTRNRMVTRSANFHELKRIMPHSHSFAASFFRVHGSPTLMRPAYQPKGRSANSARLGSRSIG